MADWFGTHRIYYVLFVLLFTVALWLGTGLGPARRLIRAWQNGHPVPYGLVRRCMTSAGFGVFGLFLISQFAYASAHLTPASPLSEYLIWFAGALVLPLATQWAVWRAVSNRLVINPIYDDEFSGEVRLPWRLFLLVAAVLLSLPVTEVIGLDQPLAWLVPFGVLTIGGLWVWRHYEPKAHG